MLNGKKSPHSLTQTRAGTTKKSAALLARSAKRRQALVTQQLLKRVPRLALTRQIGPGRHKFAPDHLEVLAIVGQVLVPDRVGPPIAALLGHSPVVADAIETDFQVRTAAGAGLRTAGSAGELVLRPALPTMSCHCHRPSLAIGARFGQPNPLFQLQLQRLQRQPDFAQKGRQ